MSFLGLIGSMLTVGQNEIPEKWRARALSEVKVSSEVSNYHPTIDGLTPSTG